MTAHVLVPSIDEEKPATLSRRIVYDLLRDELGFEGVILSDDLEMKAMAATYSVPEAAVQAIAAGCDGAVCDLQPARIECRRRRSKRSFTRSRTAAFRYKRLEDALTRQRRAKERFLAARRCSRAGGQEALAAVVGCDAHRRIADEMAPACRDATS